MYETFILLACSGLKSVAEGPHVEYTGSNDPDTPLLNRHGRAPGECISYTGIL